MTNKSCEQIRDLLVDDADGELSAQDSRVVAEHLAGCAQCRELRRGLERSLHLARLIWLDNLEAAPTAAARGRVVPWLSWVASAAAILILTGVFLLQPVSGPPQPDYAYAQAERKVVGAATAARLLAATQILAQCEGTESIIEEQYRYILRHYADTPAAATLRNSNSFRRGSL